MAKKELTETQRLLNEANKISYRLRSTFFYRKLHEYQTLTFPAIINQLIPHAGGYNWDERSNSGISEDAFSKVTASDLLPIQVFTHPRILREQPRLTAYYRNVAALSRKATGYLAGTAPDRYEDKEGVDMKEETAFSFAKLFNEHVSLIVESAYTNFSADELNGMLLASTGAQIDGSWRNSIGEEAEKVVQTMLVQEVIRLEMLQAFILREGGIIESPTEERTEYIIKNIRVIKGVMLTNQKSILFSSEPDLTFLSRNGQSELVIEVKGGNDKAGALERFGAAKKSFGHERTVNPTVLTCLVASCITSEVEARITKDKDFSQYFNLTQLVIDDVRKEQFLDYLTGILTK